MTHEEKTQQMLQRNKDICACYAAGNKVAAVASRFQLGRMRVLQILQSAGVWKPYVKSGRTAFIGVNVSEATKAALVAKADAEETSVSVLASEVLDKAVEAR